MIKEDKLDLADRKNSFARTEIGPVVIVSLIVALRLLGIFLMLPIFSAYVIRYPGATLPLAGIAFGIYALTQSLFQIPMGWASDRWGRKPVLLIGLALFALGSLICGLSQDIFHLIVARAIQGSGAVGSVAVAALADLTRPSVRAQAFTVTGIAIGSAFMIGLLTGPILAAQVGLSGLFYLLALLGGIAFIFAQLFFPAGKVSAQEEPQIGFKAILHNPDLRPIFLAGFVLSFTLNLFFFTYPLSLTYIGFEKSQLWEVYLIIFIPSLLLVFPYVRYAERRGNLWLPTRLGWSTVSVGYFAYLIGSMREWLLYAAGATFFLGYSLFQPLLPSFLTQRIPPGGRGVATGFYNFSGFLGASLGGMLAGELLHLSRSLPEAVGLVLLLLWLFMGLPNPPDTPG
jgi:MFS family permease